MTHKDNYQAQFKQIESWIPSMISELKGNIRNEHLKKDPRFVRQHFSTGTVNKISLEEMTRVYQELLLADGQDSVREFIANRWLLKHADLYEYFERELSRIDPNFSDLKEIEPASAYAIMEASIRQFGAVDTYLFCVLNSVVFPESVYRQLENLARHETASAAMNQQVESKQKSQEHERKDHEQLMSRLIDRYEKKIGGLERKYMQDIDSLRRQVSNLQRKLAEVEKK